MTDAPDAPSELRAAGFPAVFAPDSGEGGLPYDLIRAVVGPRAPSRAVRRGGRPWVGLADLSRMDPDGLGRSLDLLPRAAERLAAAFELGRRVERARSGLRPRVDGPDAAHRLLAPRLRGLDRETFWVLLLDARHAFLGLERVSEGTLTTSLVHPREVFAPAIRRRAAAVLVAHNHPSGDPEPSEADREVTRRLEKAGQLLGIPLVDHLVVAGPEFASLRSQGVLSGRGWGLSRGIPSPEDSSRNFVRTPRTSG